MILFHPFSPDPAYLERRSETIDWLVNNSVNILDLGWEIITYPCEKTSDYEDKFRELWGKDDLIIWEHDIVPTMEAIIRLAECEYDLCVNDYPFWRLGYQPIYGKPAPLKYRSSCRNVAEDGSRQDSVDEWADYVGFGLTKINRKFQVEHELGMVHEDRWDNLDTRFCRWTYSLGYRWHVHRPMVKHNHYPEGR